MRIKLEFEPRDVRLFATASSQGESFRTFMVRINGKNFNVWRSMTSLVEFYENDQRYMEMIDRDLVLAMEQMLTQIFNDACAAVPVGAELLRR